MWNTNCIVNFWHFLIFGRRSKSRSRRRSHSRSRRRSKSPRRRRSHSRDRSRRSRSRSVSPLLSGGTSVYYVFILFLKWAVVIMIFVCTFWNCQHVQFEQRVKQIFLFCAACCCCLLNLVDLACVLIRDRRKEEKSKKRSKTPPKSYSSARRSRSISRWVLLSTV